MPRREMGSAHTILHSRWKDQRNGDALHERDAAFFEDDGSTLWITFVGQRLYWGLLTADPPEQHSDGTGVWRTVAEGWRWHDVKGEQLTKAR
jgi:hypothetical protein